MVNNERRQSLISKYVWTIETIYKARKISFKELNEKWLDDDISRGVAIAKRTFDNWRYNYWCSRCMACAATIRTVPSWRIINCTRWLPRVATSWITTIMLWLMVKPARG